MPKLTDEMQQGGAQWDDGYIETEEQKNDPTLYDNPQISKSPMNTSKVNIEKILEDRKNRETDTQKLLRNLKRENSIVEDL